MPGKDPPATLHPDWRDWIAENLLRDAEPAVLIATLTGQGVPTELASAQVAALDESPLMAPARRQVARLRKLHRLRRELEATEVPRVGSWDGFYERFWQPNRPVVVTGGVADWPAVHKWTSAWLRAEHGTVPVQVFDDRHPDVHTQDFGAHTHTLPLADYLDRIDAEPGDRVYLVARNYNLRRGALAPLLQDLAPLPPVLDPARTQRSASLWLGPAGTVTPLHHDENNILFCQLRGTKRFHLASPAEDGLIEDAIRHVYSAHDPEREPGAAGWLTTTVGPGDALFLPVGWWHHVRALEWAASVTLTNFHWPNDFGWYTRW